MAKTIKVGYKEPADYFSKEMRKAMDDWEKKNAQKQKELSTKKPASPKK